MADESPLVKLYFTFGMTHKEIACTLASKHGLIVSTRHLKRILKALNLTPRKNGILGDVVEFVRSELKGMLILPKVIFQSKHLACMCDACAFHAIIFDCA